MKIFNGFSLKANDPFEIPIIRDATLHKVYNHLFDSIKEQNYPVGNVNAAIYCIEQFELKQNKVLDNPIYHLNKVEICKVLVHYEQKVYNIQLKGDKTLNNHVLSEIEDLIKPLNYKYTYNYLKVFNELFEEFEETPL